jgi:hypothetical protein
MGAAASECIARAEFGVLVGMIQGQIKTTRLAEIVGKRKPLDMQLIRLARVLAQ